MDVRIINPFIQSALSMIRTCAGIEFSRGKINLLRGKRSDRGPNILVKMTGGLNGTVIYNFSEVLAIKVVEAMNAVKKSEVSRTEFDMMMEETILELGNLVSGRAITILSMENIDCDISTPELELNENKQIIPESIRVISLPLNCKYGELIINLGFEE